MGCCLIVETLRELGSICKLRWFSVHAKNRTAARQIINTKRKWRQAVMPYSTNVQDRLCRGTNWKRKNWNVASKWLLLLSAFSFLNVIKYRVYAPFYSYLNACFVQCPLFVWMYVASQKSQSSLECIQISVTVHRFFTLSWVYYFNKVKMKTHE